MKIVFSFLILSLAASTVVAQKADTISLYSSQIPNAKPTPATYLERSDAAGFMRGVSKPQLLCFYPATSKANGAAVIICPGGGYAGLAMRHEGAEIAKRFTDLGVTAFVLKYRLPSDSIMVNKSIGPLQDAQRAIQLVRENADKWLVDPGKIGVMGFSAGGHLASTLATHYQNALIENAKHTSLRPDFAILIYPVISFANFTHMGSRENLIGKNAPQQLVNLYSSEKQVTQYTPPTFLLHAQDDDVVPVQNALSFFSALHANKVKAEMHLPQAGGHGFGLHNTKEPGDWFALLTDWMKVNSWLK